MTSQEVSKSLGVTIRQLQHWRESGAVVPYKVDGDCVYQEDDAIRAGLAKALRSKKMPWSKVRAVLRQMKHTLKSRFVVTDGNIVRVVESHTAATQLLLRMGASYVVDLNEIRAKIGRGK